MAQLNAPFNPNKPTTPQKPNGIAHMTTTITGTDGLITTVKAERATMKADWAAWVADWKTKYKAGDLSSLFGMSDVPGTKEMKKKRGKSGGSAEDK